MNHVQMVGMVWIVISNASVSTENVERMMDFAFVNLDLKVFDWELIHVCL